MRAAVALLFCCPSLANVTLPALISAHMVLQQGMPVRIWGRAEAGERVRVQFQGQRAGTAADAGGKSEVWFQPLKAAGASRLREYFGLPAPPPHKRIESFGGGGRLIAATSHNIRPDTPIENALALYRAVGGLD